MSKEQTTVELQKEHGLAYGDSGEYVIRVNKNLIWSGRVKYAEAKVIANAVFNGLAEAGLTPRWAYHPALEYMPWANYRTL